MSLPRGWARWGLRGLLLLLVLVIVGYGVVVVRAIIWPVRAKLPELPAPRAGETILVVSPHEDDETLGCAGYMQQAVTRGVPVWVCLMTSGEGEELGTAWATHRPLPSAKQFVRLGKIRQQESIRALAGIGVPADHLIFLGYPNMGLRWMWSAQYWSPSGLWRSPYTKTDHSPFDDGPTPHAPFCGASALHDLQAVISRVHPRHILVTGPEDIHPDHWATYCFTKLALQELQARRLTPEPDLLTFLVHRRGWPVPWGYYPHLELAPPGRLVDLPIMQWFRWDLTREQTLAKNRMVFSYRSQVPAFDLLLRSFARRNELFARVTDVPLPGRHEPALEALGREPRGEYEYLRLYPRFDLTEVTARESGAWLVVTVQTAAPVVSGEVLLLLTVVDPDPGGVRSVQVQYLPRNRTIGARVATDTSGATSTSGPDIAAQTEGTSLRISLPDVWTRGHGFMIDVLTLTHRRIVDHSVTRLVRHRSSPTRRPEHRGRPDR